MRRVAFYPGTFDPPTLGHLSVIRRAAQLFDHLVVLVAINPNKDPLFGLDERLEMLRDLVRCLGNVEVSSTTRMVVQFIADTIMDHEAHTSLIRGVRSAEDFEEELVLANINRELSDGIETLFFPAPPALEVVSSSVVRQRLAAGAALEGICHPRTLARLTGIQS